jgi:chemotaxis response regulator CheB
VTGEASSGVEAVALATETLPDVVLMDIGLPGLDGLAATRRILADSNLSQVRVVILTADEREEDLFGALRSGASGFVRRERGAASFRPRAGGRPEVLNQAGSRHGRARGPEPLGGSGPRLSAATGA